MSNEKEFIVSEDFGLFRFNNPIILCKNLTTKDIKKCIPLYFFDRMSACLLYVEGIYYGIKGGYNNISLEDMINHKGCYKHLSFVNLHNDNLKLHDIFNTIHDYNNYRENINEYMREINKITDFYTNNVVIINTNLDEAKNFFPYIFEFHKTIGKQIKDSLNFSKECIIESINEICDVDGVEIAKALVKKKLENIIEEL